MTAVPTPAPDVLKGGLAHRLAAPFTEAWRYRELIRVIVGRELTVRFKASALGPAWAVISPLVLLAVYVVAFNGLIGTPAGQSTGNRALSIFVALVFFNLLAELAGRAPLLIQEHMHFIKRTIFPPPRSPGSRSSARSSMPRSRSALPPVHAGDAGLSWTVLLVPLVAIPYVLFLLGLVWFLSALGAFTRDLAYLMLTIIPVLIFVTPVFYAIGDLPEGVRWLSYFNPAAGFIEMGRDLILRGRLFDPLVYVVSTAGSLVVFYWGYALFQRYRRILVDVI